VTDETDYFRLADQTSRIAVCAQNSTRAWKAIMRGLLSPPSPTPSKLRLRFQLASGPCAQDKRSGQNHSPAEEQSRMWSEVPGQPDHRLTQTFADSVRILVDFAAGRAELPCIRQADDKSPGRLWSLHQVGDRQVGYYEVRAGRREPPSNSQIVWQAGLGQSRADQVVRAFDQFLECTSSMLEIARNRPLRTRTFDVGSTVSLEE
jgi:hypothetical protein